MATRGQQQTGGQHFPLIVLPNGQCLSGAGDVTEHREVMSGVLLSLPPKGAA